MFKYLLINAEKDSPKSLKEGWTNKIQKQIKFEKALKWDISLASQHICPRHIWSQVQPYML